MNCDPLYKLINGDRLSKDITTLMNSTFWIDALKKGFAHGIGDELHSDLTIAHDYVREFVKNFIEMRHIMFSCSVYAFDDIDLCYNEEENIMENEFVAYYAKYALNETEKYSDIRRYLPKFLLECAYLAIIESTDFLGSTSSIAHKIKMWFPDIKLKNVPLKAKLECLMKRSMVFKRLVNYDKNNRKPIILGKQQKLWSIDWDYFKAFIRNFLRLQRMAVIKQTCHKIILSKNKPSFKVWKQRIEKFKLLMQIRHNGYLWLNNTGAEYQNYQNIDKPKTPIQYDIKKNIYSSQIYSMSFLFSPEPSLVTPILYHSNIFHSSSPSRSIENVLNEDVNDNNEIDLSVDNFLF